MLLWHENNDQIMSQFLHSSWYVQHCNMVELLESELEPKFFCQISIMSLFVQCIPTIRIQTLHRQDRTEQIDGFEQDYGISSAITLEIPQSCTKPMKWSQFNLPYMITCHVYEKHIFQYINWLVITGGKFTLQANFVEYCHLLIHIHWWRPESAWT